MFKPFKINFTDYNGKRTSTTVNWHIAEFYSRICHEKEYFDFVENNPNDDDRVNFIRNLVQKFVIEQNEQGFANSKAAIEFMLLVTAEHELVKGRQLDLL